MFPNGSASLCGCALAGLAAPSRAWTGETSSGEAVMGWGVVRNLPGRGAGWVGWPALERASYIGSGVLLVRSLDWSLPPARGRAEQPAVPQPAVPGNRGRNGVGVVRNLPGRGAGGGVASDRARHG
jgi:hypothetical protein